MRRIIIFPLLGALLGFVLGSADVFFNTWQFWAVWAIIISFVGVKK